ncbi:MAG: lipid-A-disaccharide synthase, partial [Bacteroidetes bacterium]
SAAALFTSGTATLETALRGTPEVVCYKGSSISYEIAKRIVSIKYISLVNLIMDKEAVVELIQSDFNVKKLKLELDKLLFDDSKINQIKADYQQLKTILGNSGASMRAAEIIASQFKKSRKFSSPSITVK